MSDTPIPDDLTEWGHEREDLVSKYVAQDVLAVVERERDAARAERDTLAEMVRIMDARVEVLSYYEDDYLLSAWKAPAITPEQAERFRAVLDRITKETSDDE